MQIAIIDDKKEDLLHLTNCLKRYGVETNQNFEICTFQSAVDFFKEYAPVYDFIIFDIDMPGLNGMEAAKKLRVTDPDVPLMFVTNMPQYALEGYSVAAVDYALKPIAYPDFRIKMQKALRFIERNQEHHIKLNTVNGFVSLNVSDIYFIESQLHYLIYHTKHGDIKCRSTLNTAEQDLCKYHFARSSASYLVNLKHLQSMNGNDIVVGNVNLRISRGKRSSFLSDFTKYMGGINT